MGWTKKSGVAQYAGADWNNLVQKQSDCSPAQARRIAMMNPDITFFFICNGVMVLEGPVIYETFNPGDAVFFSGTPWYGSAPQCDAYEKNGMAVAYSNAKTSADFETIACYLTADGVPAVDIVSIFAANYASGTSPYFRANNNNPPTTDPFNPNIQDILSNGVQTLQNAGIVVLLTATNGWAEVGWSEFPNTQAGQTDAQAFAAYMKGIVDQYGLDGIDIDDEYSTGQPYDTSLIMVTTYLKQQMPGKLITKALWSDSQYFAATWNDNGTDITLAENLDYGWEMTYGAPAKDMLPPYVSAGMAANAVVKGYSPEATSSNPTDDVQWIVDNGYGGVMIFTIDSPDGVTLMGELVDDLEGAGNWNLDPNCGSSASTSTGDKASSRSPSDAT